MLKPIRINASLNHSDENRSLTCQELQERQTMHRNEQEELIETGSLMNSRTFQAVF